MSEDVIAEIKRDYIYSLANQGDRADGRKFDEFRDDQRRDRRDR